MAALVRVNQNGKHSELLFDLRLTRLRSDLKDVVRVHEGVVKQPVELVLLVELGVLLGQLSHLKHYLLELLLH